MTYDGKVRHGKIIQWYIDQYKNIKVLKFSCQLIIHDNI